jgi:hypothetical protein
MPVRPAQIYETTVYDRESGQWISLASAPLRSLADRDAAELATEIAGDDGAHVATIEPWGLPFLIDAVLRQYPSLGWEWDRWEHLDRFVLYRNRDGPSAFAQQLAYDRIVPVESSPLTSRSLAELFVGGGAVTAYVTHHPALILAGPAGVLLCTVARHLGDGIGVPMRDRLWRALGASEDSLGRDVNLLMATRTSPKTTVS